MSDYAQTVPSVGFGEAVRLYFSNYTNFSGRSRRSEFWKAQLFLMLMSCGGYVLSLFLLPVLGEAGALIASLISGGWALATLIPTWSLIFRRLHDTGRSAWNLLWALIPLVGSIIVFVFYCSDSTEDNQWGPNPKCPTRKQIPRHAEVVADVPVSSRPAVIPVNPDPEHTVFRPMDTVPPTGQPKMMPPAPPAASPAVLTVCTGPLKGAIYLCEAGKSITIGRSSSCDVSLSKYQSVSGRHCYITARDHCITLTDLNSTNGTLVGGKRLPPNQPVILREGASFSLGDSNCTINVRFQ